MARNISRKEPNAEAVTASPEVDFALVLSRMIDSVSADPEQLRTAVYELARHKLREQIADEVPDEMIRLDRALEVAIQGVETHFNRLELRSLEAPDGPVPQLKKPSHEPDRGRQTARRRWEFTAPWRYLTVLAVVMAVGFAIQQRVNPLAMLRSNVGQGVVGSKTVSKPVQAPSEQAPLAQPETAQARAGSILPTTFGVYAVSDGKLYPLELLPGRAPNPRVAISAAISTPSKTMLPDRHIKFIVFRRELGHQRSRPRGSAGNRKNRAGDEVRSSRQADHHKSRGQLGDPKYFLSVPNSSAQGATRHVRSAWRRCG